MPLDFDLPRRPRRAACQRVQHLALHLKHPVQRDVLELVGLRVHTNSGCVRKKKNFWARRERRAPPVARDGGKDFRML